MDYKDFEDIESLESQRIGFDFKGFLFKALNLWKLVLLCVGVALIIAYFINVRKQNIYRLDSLITIENDQNPFFTANTSISFNWGGVSGKVSSIITEVKTRTHNELVVDSLEYYKEYLRQGKYHLLDIYKESPFEVITNKSKPQLINVPIKIKDVDGKRFELSYEIEKVNGVTLQFDSRTKASIKLKSESFKQVFDYGKPIELPFFNGVIALKPNVAYDNESDYFVRYLNFDSIVDNYKNIINIAPSSGEASSVLRLSMIGKNKSKIVDYLNATAAILTKTELERKNLYATNTIKFIDSSLGNVNEDLKLVTDEMNNFRKNNKVFDVEEEMLQISNQLRVYEQEQLQEESKLNYLNSLENYLRTKTDYTQIAAPSSAGITESNILLSCMCILALSVERRNLEYSTKEGSILFDDLDRKIDTEKNVLIEAISSTRNTISVQLSTIARKIANLEGKLIGLPEDQQEYLKIQRKLDLSQEAYNIYQAKRSEAATKVWGCR